MESIKRFIARKLKLKVNEQKSTVAQPWERKFLGFSFTNAGTQAADRAESGGPVPGASAGTDAPDARCEHGTDGRRTGPLFKRLDWLFRKMRNAECAAEPREVGPAQASVCDLEAMEARLGAVH
jgi:hypothetical protein